MPANSYKQQIAAGNRDSYLGFYDTSLRFIGGTSSAPSNGTSSGMRELLGVQEIPLGVPEPVMTPVSGDDVVLGTFAFDSDQPRSYIVTMAVDDLQLQAYLLGSNIVTVAGMDVGVMDISDAPEINVCLIHQSRAKNFNPSAGKGSAQWNGVYVPLATAKVLWRQGFTQRGAAVFRISVQAQLAGYGMGGLTLYDTWGATGAYWLPIHGAYPLHLQAFVGDNAVTAIPVDHRPVSTTYVSAWRDQGVPLTVSSVSTTNKTTSVSSAPGTGIYATVAYGYDRK